MKVIDLLNKIANGEINEDIKIEYQYGLNYEYCTIREFFDRYIVDKENLNQEITLEDTTKEDKKIKKLKYLNTDYHMKRKKYGALTNEEIVLDIQTLKNYINEIIDKLKGSDKSGS